MMCNIDIAQIKMMLTTVIIPLKNLCDTFLNWELNLFVSCFKPNPFKSPLVLKEPIVSALERNHYTLKLIFQPIEGMVW